MGDVAAHGLEGGPAGRFAFGAAADAVGDHHQQREPLAVGHEVVGLGQAGLMDHHLLSEGADEEMILVLGADLLGVGEAVDVDLVVPRLAVRRGDGRAHSAGSHRSLLLRRSVLQSVARYAEGPVARGGALRARILEQVLHVDIVADPADLTVSPPQPDRRERNPSSPRFCQ